MVLDLSQLEQILFSLKRRITDSSFAMGLMEHMLENYIVETPKTALSLAEIIDSKFRISLLEKAK